MVARRRKGRKPPRRPGPRAARKKAAPRNKVAASRKAAVRKKVAARKPAPARRTAKVASGRKTSARKTVAAPRKAAAARSKKAGATRRPARSTKRPAGGAKRLAGSARRPARGKKRTTRAPAGAPASRERIAAGVPVEVGEVTHWYGRVSAALVRLSHPIHRGDTIHVRGAHTDHVQQVESLARDGAAVDEGLPGHVLGIRLEARARVGDRVYRVSW